MLDQWRDHLGALPAVDWWRWRRSSWTAANGSAPSGNNLGLNGGWDGTNAHRFLTDSAGRSLVTIYSMPAITGAVLITGTPSVAQSGTLTAIRCAVALVPDAA